MDWERVWERQRPPLSLRALARFYVAGWRLYASLYDRGWKRQVRLPVPVIGVGSLLVGGAGKTPVAIALARLLRDWRRRVVVLCSGYGGRRFPHITLLEPGTGADPLLVGDEPVEVLNALRDVPVAVGRRRVAVAQAAIERWQPDVLVLDDGFQHLPLARTLDLLVLPADRPFGNGYCLPAGPLREPPDGIARASAILFTISEPLSPSGGEGTGEGAYPPAFKVLVEPEGLERLATGDLLPPDALKGREVMVAAGIARAERFVRTVQQLGMQVSETRLFPDHYAFERERWDWARGKTLVITAKDSVKLRSRLPADCEAYALRIRACLPPDFCNWLLQRLSSAV